MKSDFLVVMTTCPDAPTAEALAVRLVDQRLAACVQILPNVRSVYRWEGQVEQAGECLLTIKTTTARYADVERCIKAGHPYELPEVVAVPMAAGSAEYLAWIEGQT